MQEVEYLKHMLAQLKINVSTDALKKAIIMPRDVDSYGEYPDIKQLLMIDPNDNTHEEDTKNKRRPK